MLLAAPPASIEKNDFTPELPLSPLVRRKPTPQRFDGEAANGRRHLPELIDPRELVRTGQSGHGADIRRKSTNTLPKSGHAVRPFGQPEPEMPSPLWGTNRFNDLVFQKGEIGIPAERISHVGDKNQPGTPIKPWFRWIARTAQIWHLCHLPDYSGKPGDDPESQGITAILHRGSDLRLSAPC